MQVHTRYCCTLVQGLVLHVGDLIRNVCTALGRYDTYVSQYKALYHMLGMYIQVPVHDAGNRGDASSSVSIGLILIINFVSVKMGL